jgi:hypothetical protein
MGKPASRAPGQGNPHSWGEQNVTARLESVRKPLDTPRNGKPQLQLHPRCQMLPKGFRDCYQFRRIKITDSAKRCDHLTVPRYSAGDLGSTPFPLEFGYRAYSHPRHGRRYLRSPPRKV